VTRFWIAAGAAAAAEGAAEHAETLLGVPMWIWQLANLVLFFGLLARLIGKPLAQSFRKRQEAVEAERQEAERLKAEATRLTTEIRERLARLDGEIEAVRARGVADGEAERAALVARADQEAERVKREAGEEIERRAGSARLGLERAASDLVAAAAVELLTREIKDDDRRRLLEDSAARLKSDIR
jgi:F-type H+-transporting ATPase subunit b